MLSKRARPEIKLIDDMYLMINGSVSVLLKLDLIQPKRHKAMPMLPIINNGSVIILLL